MAPSGTDIKSDAMDIDTPVEHEPHPLTNKFHDAEEIAEVTPDNAISVFKEILAYEPTHIETEAVNKLKEQSIYKLGLIYTLNGRAQELGSLLQSVRPFFATIPKAKTGKIVRTVIDMVSNVKKTGFNVLQLQADLCRDSIEWCNKEKHSFLRQRVEAKLSTILFEQHHFQESLELVNKLIGEIKRLDDKQLLVEIHLTESRLHHALRNVPKAKAALTASRTAANAIYVTPRVQSQIDKMSGTLHAEEKDYKTAYSYFFEAFEACCSIDDADALPCLKYMILCKIASGNAADVQAIINGKQGVKYAGIDLEAMRAVAQTHEKRSLEDFETTLKEYSQQLVEDPLINRHLAMLYENLLESNLLKIIEPFSCVEIDHVAKLIKLPLHQIETKLSQMILDRRFHGILDQGKGQLIIYNQPPEDITYTEGLKVIAGVGNVVDSLFRRAEHLSS